MYSEPYTNNTFFVDFCATDGIGRLKKQYLPASFYSDKKSITSIIAECLKLTGNNLPISIAPAIENATVTFNQDKLDIDTAIFLDNDKKKSAYDILNDIIVSMGCKLFQFKLRWYIIGINQMGIDTNIAVDISAPTVPASVGLTRKTDTTASFSWLASTDNVGVTGYKIYKDAVYVNTTTNLNYTFTGLTANTAYVLTVSAIDAAANESAQSANCLVTTNAVADVTPPAVPTTLAVNSVTVGSIALTWDANVETDLHGYKLYVDTLYTKTVFTNATTISGLTSNTSYDLQISAFDTSDNESALTTAVVGTTSTSTDSIAPSVPGNVHNTFRGSTALTIEWDASTDNVGVTNYNVYRSADGAAYGLLTTLGNVTTFEDTGLTSGLVYKYKISAIDAALNESSQSIEISVITI